MSAQPVEWVLVVRYGKSAHRATYGRLAGTAYTKDYIQLSRTQEFIEDLEAAFPGLGNGGTSVTIEYKWPLGSAVGAIFKQSADRPHLVWGTKLGAPAAWKMSDNPSKFSAETIRGDPSHSSAVAADNEYAKLITSGFGQPFLIAVKLKGEDDVLHLSVLVDNPDEQFIWADLKNVPQEIQALAAETSARSVLAWKLFTSEDELQELYFDSSKKIKPWSFGNIKETRGVGASDSFLGVQTLSHSLGLDNDLFAENLPHSKEKVSEFKQQLDSGDYLVPDKFSTIKTRGSAQRAFAAAVKKNYDWRCALTGISTPQFLVASHIVPWSVDECIRLDPANGICLSIFVDRAFESGFLIFEDDLTVKVNWKKVKGDSELMQQLAPYDGANLHPPKAQPPKIEYLKRRRSL